MCRESRRRRKRREERKGEGKRHVNVMWKWYPNEVGERTAKLKRLWLMRGAEKGR